MPTLLLLFLCDVEVAMVTICIPKVCVFFLSLACKICFDVVRTAVMKLQMTG